MECDVIGAIDAEEQRDVSKLITFLATYLELENYYVFPMTICTKNLKWKIRKKCSECQFHWFESIKTRNWIEGNLFFFRKENEKRHLHVSAGSRISVECLPWFVGVMVDKFSVLVLAAVVVMDDWWRNDDGLDVDWGVSPQPILNENGAGSMRTNKSSKMLDESIDFYFLLFWYAKFSFHFHHSEMDNWI